MGEAVEAIHGDLSAKKAELAGVIEGMGSAAIEEMEAIKAAEELADAADKKYNAFKAAGAKEKAALQAELKKTKEGLTAEKDVAAAALSDKKAAFDVATGNYSAKKAGIIGAESANAAGKGDVLLIMDDIAKLDKLGTALLRDKKEMLAAAGHLQQKLYLTQRVVTLMG